LGGDVHMVGRVGNDGYGEWLVEQLQAAGVDTSHVGRDDRAATGMAFIKLDASGQNQIVIVGGANAAVSPDDVSASAELFANAGYVLLQLEIPMPAVLSAARLAKASGAEVILDPAPAAELPDELMQLVDWVTPNETELATLLQLPSLPSDAMDSPEAVRHAHTLLRRGVKQVIVKCGASGAMCFDGDTKRAWSPFEVDPIDTVAAGDVWNGAFAVALSEGHTPEHAGRFANGAAALSVTRAGAQASMPSRSEVDRFLSPKNTTGS
jgi:ribokinase